MGTYFDSGRKLSSGFIVTFA